MTEKWKQKVFEEVMSNELLGSSENFVREAINLTEQHFKKEITQLKNEIRTLKQLKEKFRKEAFWLAEKLAHSYGDWFDDNIHKTKRVNKRWIKKDSKEEPTIKPNCEKEHPEYVRTYTKEWTLDDKGNEVYPKICDKCNVIWYE